MVCFSKELVMIQAEILFWMNKSVKSINQRHQYFYYPFKTMKSHRTNTTAHVTKQANVQECFQPQASPQTSF